MLRLNSQKLYKPTYVEVFVKIDLKPRPPDRVEAGFNCGNSFDVYRTRYVDIPAFKPGERMVVAIHLDHLRYIYEGYDDYFYDLYYGRTGKPYI